MKPADRDAKSERIRIHEADCLEVLRALPDGSVDAVICDPPFGVSFRSKQARFRPILNDERPFIWWLHDAGRVLKDGGALLSFCQWEVQEAFRLAIEWAGLKVRSQVVWDSGIPGAGDIASAFGRQHACLWFATKGRFRFPVGRPKSVLRVMRVDPRVRSHPTEKPVDLMRPLVRAVTEPGDLVVDPFMGSGATGVACVLEGRRFIGIEQEADYVKTARERIREADREKTSA